MFKIEERFWNWVEKHIMLFCALAVSLVAALIRYSFRENVSNDAYWCLLPWFYSRIHTHTHIQSL